MRVVVLGGADTVYEVLRAFFVEELENACPVGEVEAVSEATRPIAEERDSSQSVSRLTAGDGMVGSRRIRGSNPEATVAVATPLKGLDVAPKRLAVFWRACGQRIHFGAIGAANLGLAVVGQDNGTGVDHVEHKHRISQYQILNYISVHAHRDHSRRWGARVS